MHPTNTPAQRLDTLAHWVNERWRILQRKRARRPEPWTQDRVLREYRFCNVRREDDRTTQWIAQHWRTPHANDADVWFAMTVARMLNHPPSLHAIGYPLPWNAARVERVLLARGQQVFGAAYIIGTAGKRVAKVPYVVSLLDAARTLEYPPRQGDTLARAHDKLRAAAGLGSFMAAQVVADLKHTATLANATDWWDWAAPGPGSLRGLHWLETGVLLDKRGGSKANFVARLLALRQQVKPLLAPGVPRLCLQDFQNCLCELSKYVRGYGKQRYVSLEAELLG